LKDEPIAEEQERGEGAGAGAGGEWSY